MAHRRPSRKGENSGDFDDVVPFGDARVTGQHDAKGLVCLRFADRAQLERGAEGGGVDASFAVAAEGKDQPRIAVPTVGTVTHHSIEWHAACRLATAKSGGNAVPELKGVLAGLTVRTPRERFTPERAGVAVTLRSAASAAGAVGAGRAMLRKSPVLRLLATCLAAVRVESMRLHRIERLERQTALGTGEHAWSDVARRSPIHKGEN